MSSSDFLPYGNKTYVLDLGNGEENLYVNQYGGIELQPDFTHDLYLRLGKEVFTISRIESPAIPDDMQDDLRQSHNLYVLRNALKRDILFDDGLVPVETSREASSFANLTGLTQACAGPSFTVGRRTTPALGLSRTVDQEHLLIQVETISRNLQLTDLRSSTGTLVGIHCDDIKMLIEPWNVVPLYRENTAMTAQSSLRRLVRKLFPKRSKSSG